jgi:hypothetical protein
MTFLAILKSGLRFNSHHISRQLYESDQERRYLSLSLSLAISPLL